MVHVPSSTDDKTLLVKRVQHFVPNFIAMYVGKDKFGKKFSGQMQKWSASHGKGAFTLVSRRGYEENLLYYNAVRTDNRYSWSLPDDRKKVTESVDQVFMEEAESVTEYSVGMWTRWTNEIP